jgi:hypothetical protein
MDVNGCEGEDDEELGKRSSTYLHLLSYIPEVLTLILLLFYCKEVGDTAE